ncbi:MAG: type II secretion system minor pseudopilin GspK [Nitrospirota bacterium]|nr:MAG: type II secretion system minor pseudopilin GspK [Nitrospirota bacterium]
MLKNNDGIALVMVLMIIAILAAVVAEFAYRVHNETISLYSWRDSQRLSGEASSGIKVGEQYLVDTVSRFKYTYPGRLDLPLPDVTGDGMDSMVISVIDENAKFNINKLVEPNDTPNVKNIERLGRLFNILEIDERLVERIVDWVDRNKEERVSGSERSAKNGYLYSIDELLLINGMTTEIYNKLLPHVTIFGDGNININSAGIYVLMSMSSDISEELALRIVNYRELKPFQDASHIQRVAGFSGELGTSLMGSITVKGNAFHIIAVSSSDRIRKQLEAAIELNGRTVTYKYWRES